MSAALTAFFKKGGVGLLHFRRKRAKVLNPLFMTLQLFGASSFLGGSTVHASCPTTRVVVGTLVVGALIIRDKQTHTEGARPPARRRHPGQGAPANSRPPGGLGVAPFQLHPTWGEL